MSNKNRDVGVPYNEAFDRLFDDTERLENKISELPDTVPIKDVINAYTLFMVESQIKKGRSTENLEYAYKGAAGCILAMVRGEWNVVFEHDSDNPMDQEHNNSVNDYVDMDVES